MPDRKQRKASFDKTSVPACLTDKKFCGISVVLQAIRQFELEETETIWMVSDKSRYYQ